MRTEVEVYTEIGKLTAQERKIGVQVHAIWPRLDSVLNKERARLKARLDALYWILEQKGAGDEY